ncbi:MAG: nucleotidyltransferase domain-containing protein [bacterium]|nr:nucleotidyltransferase domain-containing protein [bacterium]
MEAMETETQAIVQRLGALLLEEERVRLAYLFGSLARGRTHRTSDVDVAVLYAPGFDAGDRLRLNLDLAFRLSRQLKVTVDIIDLAAARASLKHQVLRDGLLVLERDHAERVAFEVSARRGYLDLRRHLEKRARAILGRL